jgi:hypothetical protein
MVSVARSQAFKEVVFDILVLERAEKPYPNWLLDPQDLCGEKGASVSGVVTRQMTGSLLDPEGEAAVPSNFLMKSSYPT